MFANVMGRIQSSETLQRLKHYRLPLWRPHGNQTLKPGRLAIGGRCAQGEVFLVGAGPGDPGLLTVKAYELIKTADVVLYDALVSRDIMNLCAPSAEIVFVGKRRSNHAMSQVAICQLMISYAKEGRNVLRLKGGDPSLFARTTEEREALRWAGIQHTVVPGITAASGAAAACGICLTERGRVRKVTLETATLGNSGACNSPQSAVKFDETRVLYMGLSKLPKIAQQLIILGTAPNTPVLVVENATLSSQRECTGELQNIASRVARRGFRGPAVIIMGAVVAIRGTQPLNIHHANV